MFVAECTEPECTWRELHTALEPACTDAKRHRVEYHPRAWDTEDEPA